jgi:hypothetical protein
MVDRAGIQKVLEGINLVDSGCTIEVAAGFFKGVTRENPVFSHLAGASVAIQEKKRHCPQRMKKTASPSGHKKRRHCRLCVGQPASQLRT